MKSKRTRKPTRPPKPPSKWEASFAWHWRLLGGPQIDEQAFLVPGEAWRFDFAHEPSRTAVELNGGTMSGGRHNRGPALETEYRKHNAAQSLGWVVLTYGTKRMERDMVGIVEEVMAVVRRRMGEASRGA